MSLVRITNFERFADRIATAMLLVLGVSIAAATAVVGA